MAGFIGPDSRSLLFFGGPGGSGGGSAGDPKNRVFRGSGQGSVPRGVRGGWRGSGSGRWVRRRGVTEGREGHGQASRILGEGRVTQQPRSGDVRCPVPDWLVRVVWESRVGSLRAGGMDGEDHGVEPVTRQDDMGPPVRRTCRRRRTHLCLMEVATLWTLIHNFRRGVELS